MTQEQKKQLILDVLTKQWWKSEFDGFFTDDITMEFPFAPPGMAQNLCTGQVIAHKEWLNRSVYDWKTEVISLYGPKDPEGDCFFLTWTVHADVYWGGHKGVYNNRNVTRVTLRDGKISNIREWSNPFKYIEAAGREIPKFHVSLPLESIVQHIHEPAREKPQYDLSPEACQARHDENVDRFVSTKPGYSGAPIESPDGYTRFVWFVPPEMRDSYTSEEGEIMELWTQASMKSWDVMDDAICYETESPKAYFFETGGYGSAGWLGNDSFGGYMNRYIKYIELDDNGFVTRYDEYLNPINKMNSINRSIPSFPWLY